MRTLNKNKQKMWYSLQNGKSPVYETDASGQVIYYTDEDGNRFPLKTGEKTIGYTEPVAFQANINNKLTEAKWQEYGIDKSTNYSQIVIEKGKIPIKEGDVVWKNNEVQFIEDVDQKIVNAKSADYIVRGVANEGLNFDLFLLQKQL